MRHERTATGEQHYVHVFRPQFRAVECVGERCEDGKRQHVVRFAGVHHFQIQKRLQDFLPLGRAEFGMGEQVVPAADGYLRRSLPGYNLGLVGALVKTVQVKLRDFAAKTFLECLGAATQCGFNDFLAVSPLKVTRR